MLSSLLGQVGTVLSRLFVFASFVPMLVFAFVNAALLFFWHETFRQWAAPQIEGSVIAFYAVVALVAIAVLAYVLFALNNSLRMILERGRFAPPFLRRAMSGAEQQRLDAIVTRYIAARDSRRALEGLRGRDTRLEDARIVGAALQVSVPNLQAGDPAAKQLESLEKMKASHKVIPVQAIEDAIKAFETALKTGHIKRYSLFERDYRTFLAMLDYAVDRQRFKENQEFARQQFEFGYALMPTRLGNVAQSIQGYAKTRYGLDLDLLSTRFFTAIRQDKDMQGAIDDARTQLDFLVACCWLSALTTLGWMVALVLLGHSVWAFLVLGVAGHTATYVFYLFAVRGYTLFADVVRTAIDQGRGRILDAMGLPAPGGLREERHLWQAVNALVRGGGDDLDLSYRARAAPSTTAT